MTSSAAHPRISVVTPSWNQGPYIGQSIQSVLDQGYDNLEYIICDNESTDQTAEVVQGFSDSRIHLYIEPDQGQSDALNKGINRATGEYILWLNADDYLHRGALQAMLAACTGPDQADVAYGHVDFVDEQGRFIKTVFQVSYTYALTLFGWHIPPTSGTLFRAGTLKENPLDVRYHYRMDYEWFLRCGRTVRMRLVNRPISFFRVSEFNKTGSQITTGQVKPQHQKEREMDLERHVYPQLAFVPAGMRPAVYRLLRSLARVLYYGKKMRFVRGYLALKRNAARPADQR